MMKSTICAALTAAIAVAALPAHAQEAGTDAAWSFGGEVTVASDYVWRGVSQTMEDPALQLDLNVGHASGFYVGVAGSNVDFGDPDDGMDYEVAGYIGWAGELGAGTELDVVISHVAYPGHNGPDYDIDYTEIEANLAFAEYYNVGVAYSPDIFNLGAKSWYYYAGADFPLGDTGLILGLQVGHFDLDAAAGDSYSDWLVSLARDFGPINARLQYSDTSSYSELVAASVGDSRLADGRLALVLSWGF
ncbi:TorF family putative porin [Luteimonas sp. MJ293]|uniref:TorF family putative porin n=1 Tax=Luteimonas sp. MJ146 TaxID=3129240 RepID=UPI0031BB29B3